MRAEIESLKADITKSINLLRKRLNWDEATRRFDELEALSQTQDFWDNPQKAQALMREKNKIQISVDEITSLERELNDNIELAELADLEGDEDLINEA